MTGSSRSSRCCARAKIKFIARVSTIQRNSPTAFLLASKIFSVTRALMIGSVEANYFTAAQKELIQQFVDRRGGGLLMLGGRASLGDGGWESSSLADLLPVVLPNQEGDISPRPGHRFAYSGRRRQHHHATGRRPNAKNVERWKKLPVLDGLPGSRHAETRRGGSGRNDGGRPEDAAAHHRKLRARKNRGAGHRRHVALANEPAARRPDA